MKLLLTFILGFNYHENYDISNDERQTSSNVVETMKMKSILESYNQYGESIKHDNFIHPSVHLRTDVKIHYELPKEGNKTITVVYLGSMAYVSIDNTTIPIKCTLFDNVSFLSFTVIHMIKTSELSAPVTIRNKDIHFNFKVTEWGKNKIERKLYYFIPEKIGSNYGYLLESKNQRIPEKLTNLYVKVNNSDYLIRSTCRFHRENVNIIVGKAVVELKMILEELELERLEQERLEMERLELEKLEQEKLELERSFHETVLEENTIEEFSFGTASEKSSKKKKDKKAKNNKANKGKKTNKQKKSAKNAKSEDDKKRSQEIKLHLTGNQLLFEKSVTIVGDINNESDILYSGLMCTTTNVLTTEQRSHYKTLAVNIKSIKNLPPSVKDLHDIHSISMEYSFPPVCNSDIVEEKELYDISKIKFNHFKTYLNDNIPNEKLIEAMQTGCLNVKIYGHRDKKIIDNDYKVWGQDYKCTNFSDKFDRLVNLKELDYVNSFFNQKSRKQDSVKGRNKQTKQRSKSKKTNMFSIFDDEEEIEEKESFLIGFAVIELYDLMLYSHKIVISSQLQSTLLEKMDKPSPLRPMNALHLHTDINPLIKGIIHRDEFNLHKTSIELEIKIGYNFTRNILNEVLTLTNLYTRCIIIDYNPKSGYHLLKEILKFNAMTMGEEKCHIVSCYQKLSLIPSVRPNKSTYTASIDDEDEEPYERPHLHSFIGPKPQNYCTGFLIDAIDYTILMLECLEIDAVSRIMTYRYEMPQEDGRMLYNSNLIFTERLYDDFIEFGGIYKTSLGLPLDVILNHGKVGVWIPTPALRCLETIKRITTAKRISRDLFPTPTELLSMDIEFGVPLHKADIYL